MRLKEIKPGMAIYCTDIDQVRELDKQMKSNARFENFLSFPCYIITDKNGYNGWIKGKNKYAISSENFNPVPQIVKFSDLIIPELTAEETLLAFDQMCKENYCCNDCPIYGILGHECAHKMEGHITEIVEAIKKWKSDHEKKEPEIETVDICRIIEVLPDGHKRCVHEEDLASGSTDAEIKILVEAELKRYCMEHDGGFIAVHEVVSRAKAVE